MSRSARVAPGTQTRPRCRRGQGYGQPLARAIQGRGSTDPREWALDLGDLGHGSRRSRGKQLDPRLDCLRVTRGRAQGRTVPTYARRPLTSGEKPLAYAVMADR